MYVTLNIYVYISIHTRTHHPHSSQVSENAVTGSSEVEQLC